MKKNLTLFVLIATLSFLSGAGFAQDKSDKLEKMLSRLASLNGNWKGSLLYLDYGDNKSLVTLPTTCEAVFNKTGSDKYLFVKFIFDEGKGRTVTGEDAWTIIDEKTFFYDSTDYNIADYITAKESTVFSFEKQGEDNNKPCTIQQMLVINPDTYSIVKRVKYSDASEYFVRHQFSFERIK